MKQRNFILTDIMKTGDHVTSEKFIHAHTLPNQIFDLTGEYYTIHNYDLKRYDRRIALLHVAQANYRINDNVEFSLELQRRIKLLKSKNFKIIISSQWESAENFQRSNFYPLGYKNEFVWHGQQSWFWFYMLTKHENNTLKFDHSIKTHDYLYLNKQPRSHRLLLYKKLITNNCLDKSLYSFTKHKDPVKLDSNYELPWINTEKDYTAYGFDQDIYEKPYNVTGCSIVSETNDNDTDVFMTEKIWKPIVAGHVFIVHGNYRYLEKLKEMGYKTFESVFDESYDSIKDRNERIKVIAKLVQSLKGSDWNNIYHKTKNIRKHNQENFWNKNHLKLLINKELLRWFEFVDNSQVSSTKT